MIDGTTMKLSKWCTKKLANSSSSSRNNNKSNSNSNVKRDNP